MTVVAYRIECEKCRNDEVLRDAELDDALWKVESRTNHDGLCPECNPAVSIDDMEEAREEREDDAEAVEFEKVPGVGQSTADALRRAGVRTRGDVRLASDAKLLEVNGIGESKVACIKEHIA